MTCVETPVSQSCCRPVCSHVEYYVVWLCLLGPEDSLMIPTWLCSTRSWLRVCLLLTLVLLALKWACMFLVWISLLLQFQWVWESWEQEIRTWYVSSQLHVKNFFLFVWLFCLFMSCAWKSRGAYFDTVTNMWHPSSQVGCWSSHSILVQLQWC